MSGTMWLVSPEFPPDAIVDAISAFFAEHDLVHLELPSGWFGRPYHNLHQLTSASAEGGRVQVRLDTTQLLVLDATQVRVDGPVLHVDIRGGSWDWVEYGRQDKHHERLEPGSLKFHATNDR